MRALLSEGFNAPGLVRAFQSFAGIATSSGIVAQITPAPELLLDGQSLNDLLDLALYIEATNWVSTGGGDISVSSPVVTRISSGVEFPSSMSETQEQTDQVRVQFTVTDTFDGVRHVTLNYSVYAVATVATAGTLILDVQRNTGLFMTPFASLFEAATPNDNWTLPSNMTLSGAPAGVTLASGSLQIDTTVVPPQSQIGFSILVQDIVTVGGIDTIRTATKAAELTVTENNIGIVVEPFVAQPFEGGYAFEDTNIEVMQQQTNYTGLTNATIITQVWVNETPVDHATYQWNNGDSAVLRVGVWNNGRTPADGESDASFQSQSVAAQQLLTLSAAVGTSVSIITNANAPDAYPVNGVQINARDLDAGLIVADFETSQMQLIQSPTFAAPNGTEEGEFTVYEPPTVVIPEGVDVSVTYDLIDVADDSVILADVVTTDATLQDQITSARLGLSLYWRAKFRAVGLSDLDVDSATLTIASGMPVVPHAPLAEWDLTDPANMTVDGSNNVTGVTDLTGNGYDLTPIDSPLYVPAAAHLLGHISFENGALVIPDAMTTDVNDVTVFVVTTANFFEAGRPAKTWLSLDETEFSLMRNNNIDLGTFMSGNNHSDVSDRDNVATLYVASSATDLIVGADNDMWAKGSAGAGAAPTVGGFIGRFRASDDFRSGEGRAHAAIVYNKVLNATEIEDVRTYLAQKYNAPAPGAYDLICEGDSITKGAFATSEEYSYPSQLQRLYTPGTAPSVRNSGVSGSQVETTGAEVIALLDKTGLPNVTVPRVVFFLWGNNDFAAGNTAAQLEAEYETTWAAIRAAHPDVHIGVGSVLPNQRYDPEPRQNSFNARLAETGSGAMSLDFFIDTNAIPELNPPTVGTYFADTTGHLTDAGYAVVAATVKAGIDAYLEGL